MKREDHVILVHKEVAEVIGEMSRAIAANRTIPDAVMRRWSRVLMEKSASLSAALKTDPGTH